MNKILIVILVCLVPLSCLGRGSNDVYIYGEAGGGGGNFASGKFGVNAIYQNLCFGISYYGQFANAQNVPPDYDPGLVIFNRLPQQTLNFVCFTAGWVVYAHNPRIRYLLKGGLALGSSTLPDTYTPVYYGYFGPNYDVSYQTIFLAGLHLNPTIEFPLTRGFGLSVGLWSNINTVRSSYGIEGNILFGRLRGRMHRQANSNHSRRFGN